MACKLPAGTSTVLRGAIRTAELRFLLARKLSHLHAEAIAALGSCHSTVNAQTSLVQQSWTLQQALWAAPTQARLRVGEPEEQVGLQLGDARPVALHLLHQSYALLLQLLLLLHA